MEIGKKFKLATLILLCSGSAGDASVCQDPPKAVVAPIFWGSDATYEEYVFPGGQSCIVIKDPSTSEETVFCTEEDLTPVGPKDNRAPRRRRPSDPKNRTVKYTQAAKFPSFRK